jgi:hemerythrin-like domain-containing protein
MKRHPVLIPLSKEHHDGLILAQLLKSDVKDYKNMPSSPDEKALFARQRYENNIAQHFAKEEQMLSELAHHKELLQLTNRVIDEHKRLSAMFEDLNTETTVDALNELGHLLYNHIRMEERILFPAIEQTCSEEEFNRIQQLW